MASKTASPAAARFVSRYGALQPSERFAYVCIHPLADESVLLEKLGIVPGDCVVADSYWALGDEVLFVSVAARKDRAFASYRPGDEGSVHHYFHVSTPAGVLTTGAYEQILANLHAWFETHRSALPRGLSVFTEADLARTIPEIEH